ISWRIIWRFWKRSPPIYRHAALRPRRFHGGENHRQALDVVVTLPLRLTPGAQRFQKLPQRAGDAARIILREFGGDVFGVADEAALASDDAGHGRGFSIPDRPAARAVGAPLRFPTGRQSLGTPASAIGVEQSAGHFEDRDGAIRSLVPAP